MLKEIGQKLHKVLYAAKELQLRTLFSKELNGVEYVYVTKFTKGQSAKEVLTKLNDVITSLTFP